MRPGASRSLRHRLCQHICSSRPADSALGGVKESATTCDAALSVDQTAASMGRRGCAWGLHGRQCGMRAAQNTNGGAAIIERDQHPEKHVKNVHSEGLKCHPQPNASCPNLHQAQQTMRTMRTIYVHDFQHSRPWFDLCSCKWQQTAKHFYA